MPSKPACVKWPHISHSLLDKLMKSFTITSKRQVIRLLHACYPEVESPACAPAFRASKSSAASPRHCCSLTSSSVICCTRSSAAKGLALSPQKFYSASSSCFFRTQSCSKLQTSKSKSDGMCNLQIAFNTCCGWSNGWISNGTLDSQATAFPRDAVLTQCDVLCCR